MSAVPADVAAPPRSASVALPTALSLIAGVTDVTSWLLLGGFFSAHVTGNLVVAAADVVTGRPADLAGLLAIPVFVLVTAAATVLARAVGVAGPRVERLLLGAQAVLLIAAAALSFTTTASADPKQPIAVVIGLLAVCAMASQNAYLHLVPPKAASTAVMTGNLVAGTVAAVDLLKSRGHSTAARERCAEAWPLIAGFVVGCLIGAAGASLFGDRAAAVPAVLATALLVAAIVRRGGGSGIGGSGNSNSSSRTSGGVDSGRETHP